MSNPYQVVRDFEADIAQYCGAPACVAVSSCTAALFLCFQYAKPKSVILPRLTYVGVGMAALQSGAKIGWTWEDWQGQYIIPHNPSCGATIIDAARRFTENMYEACTLTCISFQATKILGIEHGGAILVDNPGIEAWLRKARFDGRTEGVAPKEDSFRQIGWHLMMAPSMAAVGRLKLASLPRVNADLPRSDYADLSTMEIFR